MDVFHYEGYKIYIGEAPCHSFQSANNKSYDKIFEIENDNFEFKKSIEIKTNFRGDTHSVLIIASYCTPARSFAALHRDGLFLMLNDILCVFDPKNLELSKKIKMYPMGTMFEVHPYGEDYILYGECEIYRISSDLNVQWQFSGRDIFVRSRGKEPAFELQKDRICLYDFEENYYEVSYDGKVITDRPAIR